MTGGRCHGKKKKMMGRGADGSQAIHVRLEKRRRELGFWTRYFSKGCLPNKSTYAMLIEGLCDSGDEAEITTVISMAMSSGHIDSDSWELFLTKVIGDLDSGESILNRILLENAD